ncbi:O-antigen ligase family protein [Rhizobium sp. CB3090]|uniref:O-antigen ligase family protein n=1 Tax=Rhizobium sp. CB3090 TaxID=3039156 RepID=UPI0024B1CAC3|nr:O-antigen ligase family protein [Rhizobium sp. CB3090]WFU08822.1 O-antigen ligase family protein [Rhizobium sp. CB3090]
MAQLQTNKPPIDLAPGNNAGELVPVVLPQRLIIFGSLLWLVVVSPLFVESAAYRYVAPFLALIALHYYRKAPVRPRTDWLGWLCMGWGTYVLVRFVAIFLMTPEHSIGASDWLYAYPFFFPILGVAFLLYEPVLEKIVAAVFAFALIMLIATQHFRDVFAGETVRPLIMNNQIHGAVACGMILIFTAFWLLHYLTDKSSDRSIARFAYIVSPLIAILCLIAIYGAKSKGVWLALAATLPVLGLVTLTYLRLKTGLIVVACAAVLLLGGAYAVRHNIEKTAGPTVSSTIEMIDNITKSRDLSDAVSSTITSDTTPFSMDARLQLWSNGWELFSSAPIFGWGGEWVERWKHTRYADVQYTLLHDGYLEMLVRHGLFGGLVMALILAALIVNVWRARKAGLIPRTAWHAYAVCLFFFALTLLSNSNNRLAIGESLALTSSAFACWCGMRLRGERLLMPAKKPQAEAVGA